MRPRIFQRRPFDQWVRERLVDEALDRYLAWRAESEAVDEAYGLWSSAPPAQSALPFAAYGAALDREERAATMYGSVIRRLESVLGAGRELAPAQTGAVPG
jgi:hypothetical protein